MMGIPIRGPCYVYCDKKSVLINSSGPDSVSKKKSNFIAYHCTRKGPARDEYRITCINTHENIADPNTKYLPYGAKRVKFCKMMLMHIYGYTEHVPKRGVGGCTKK